ncbi:uncharacterized protein M421DRAFT_246072 [Didymella exigua CBS 183.55]|uniref:Uncharacterized protein n=1 Tax=Didymella exigua CBS 183.55 TaxID=1150837 RepID=A0A6A5RVZ4_9PLEO|nr:uncharacterized protein M421DRAFT_246072 [Didymella exigua CBS 183.55]KAF1932651.1 hypothetical protein M421DRAFT_246072 [Didymella exigua CBS 183.55]
MIPVIDTGLGSRRKVHSAHGTMTSSESVTAEQRSDLFSHFKRSTWFSRAESFGMPTASLPRLVYAAFDIGHVFQAGEVPWSAVRSVRLRDVRGWRRGTDLIECSALLRTLWLPSAVSTACSAAVTVCSSQVGTSAAWGDDPRRRSPCPNRLAK